MELPLFKILHLWADLLQFTYLMKKVRDNNWDKAIEKEGTTLKKKTLHLTS